MYTTKRLGIEELDKAMELVERVFMEFEAPEYSDEGVATFKAFIHGNEIKEKYSDGTFTIWGELDGNELIGIFAIRDKGHITLVFTDKRYHRRGVATTLWKEALLYCRDSGFDEVTVNSSPYGRAFYESIGFKATDNEKTDDGIRYIPMKYIIERQ